MTATEFLNTQDQFKANSLKWLVLHKLEWMSANLKFKQLPMGRAFDECPKNARLPYQVALLHHNENGWQEKSRGFIVSDQWPK
jgi:hypothetical protein